MNSGYRGVSLIETMIAVTILIFVSFVGLVLFSSNIIRSDLLSKRADLVDELDKRVVEYRISGTFDSTASSDMIFSQVDVTNEGNNGNGVGNSSTDGNQSGGTTGNSTGVEYKLYKFTASYSDNSMSVDQFFLEEEA